MSVCEHADLRAIELHQPLGSNAEGSEDYPFKITTKDGETMICFGEEFCRLLLDKCPKMKEAKKGHNRANNLKP